MKLIRCVDKTAKSNR